MTNKTLPYLTCLKANVASLAAAAGNDAALVMHADTASGLLHYMTAQRSEALEFIATAYAALATLLPGLDATLGGNATEAVSVRELKSICTAKDAAAFDRCLELLGGLQAPLLSRGTPEASALCRSVMQIEAEYQARFKAAVAGRIAAARDAKAASTARNVREYDEKKLLDFIRKSFPAEPDIAIEKSAYISGGFSKFTIGITLANVKSLPKEIVLRGDAAATFGGASVVDEYRLVKTLYDNGVRVARPLALEPTGTIFGSPFLLAERLPGVILGHTFNLPKPNRAVCIDVATRLAEAHRVPLAAFGSQIGNANGKSSDKALEWIAEGLKNWEPLNMPSPAFKTAFEWLRRNAHITDKAPRGLVHGDYSLANLLVHEDKVSAILDWEFAHVANPAYDLCYHRYQAEATGSWELFLESYGKAGMPVPEEAQLNYNTLLADVRLGVMVCQVKNLFVSATDPNTATASVLIQLSYETTIERIARTLDKVL